jgi:hypothetical protein
MKNSHQLCEKLAGGHLRMSDRIAHALAALFDKHRIIFWYNAKDCYRIRSYKADHMVQPGRKGGIAK